MHSGVSLSSLITIDKKIVSWIHRKDIHLVPSCTGTCCQTAFLHFLVALIISSFDLLLLSLHLPHEAALHPKLSIPAWATSMVHQICVLLYHAECIWWHIFCYVRGQKRVAQLKIQANAHHSIFLCPGNWKKKCD